MFASIFLVEEMQFITLAEAEAAAKRLSDLRNQRIAIMIARASLKRLRVAKQVLPARKAS
jgi:hypothetical protein